MRPDVDRTRPSSAGSQVAGLAVATTVLFVLGLAAGPALAQEAGEGFVYTANEYGKSVSAIALRSGDVETAPLPISPHNIQITADGSRLLAVGDPADEAHGHDGEEVPHGASEGQGLLVVLDPDNLAAGPVATVPVGDHPAHVVVDRDGRRAFVTNAGDDTVAVVDLSTSEVVRTIQTGRYPHGLRISPDGAEAYVATVEDDSVSVVDTTTLAEVARISVGDAPVQVGFTPDGSHVYVSLRDENRIAVISTASREVVAKVDVGRNPIQVYATPDGSRVYVANQGSESEPDDTVSIIDTTTNEAIQTIQTGKGAHGVVVTDDGTRVFVTNIVDGTVSAIDEAKRNVVATFEVGDGPNGVTYRSGSSTD